MDVKPLVYSQPGAAVRNDMYSILAVVVFARALPSVLRQEDERTGGEGSLPLLLLLCARLASCKDANLRSITTIRDARGRDCMGRTPGATATNPEKAVDANSLAASE